jgi:hypothetical protein
MTNPFVNSKKSQRKMVLKSAECKLNTVKQHVPNCEGSECISNTGEVRCVPHVYSDGITILCYACFYSVMKQREKYLRVKWSDLRVYKLSALHFHNDRLKPWLTYHDEQGVLVRADKKAIKYCNI